MSTPSSPKKKPRARKLERDRARDAESKPKAGSPRHAVAKTTAAKKRAKPKSKVAKAESRAPRAPRDPDARSKAESPRAEVRGAKRSNDVWNPSGKPQRKGGEKPAGTRAARSRYEDDRLARVPRKHNDEAPTRAPRDRRDGASSSRPPRSYRDEAPTRAPRTKREEVYAPKSRLPREKPSTERVSSKSAMSDDSAEVALDAASSSWAELGVSTELLSTLKRQGIDSPFPIQAKTLPDAISGRDVLGRGQTGSGKTLAFGLAMVTRLAHRKATAKHPLGIVLVPTRELAMQVTDALMPYAQAVDLDIRLIAGGMPYAKQIDALKRGVPIVVATPGRLNDLVEQGHINLSKIEITILDEADQMCDMGFMPQIVEVLDMTKPNSQRLSLIHI